MSRPENASPSDLTADLLDRLDRVPLPPADEEILLGAVLGDGDLAAVIGGTGATVDRARVATALADSSPPAGAYLRSVAVTGFRGIGPTVKLSLEPGPGLTVVCGRNGSGKSSFAEALEVLLTGGIRRFEDRSAVWQESWRCLHGAAGPEVTAELVIAGAKGAATVRATWEPAAKRVTDATLRVSVPGEPEADLGRLGWGEAMSSFRPFLSHSELEVLLARPADLYDQLNSLLGLEQIAEIAARLAAARKRSEEIVKAPKDQLGAIKAALGASPDERAADAAARLAQKKVDLSAVEALATGSPSGEGGPVAVVSRLRDLHAPDGPLVEHARARLKDAADRLESFDTPLVREASETANLLGAALEHFETHGAGDCPVCGRSGALDAAWAGSTRARIEQHRRASAELDAARRDAASALGEARLLLAGPPADLTAAPDSLAAETAGAVELWQQWASPPPNGAGPDGLRTLAAHLAGLHAELDEAVSQVREAAAAEYARRQGDWAPLAAQLAAWCAAERAAATAKETVDRIRRVESWLKDANHELRNQRLRPFAEGTADLWARLRQKSSVDLVSMTLEGSATRRSVDFEVTVDGKQAPGLGVMSQGEINALALSVFLPRATSPDSPLRFVIIDDPVQAFDPSKVDGLARVLHDVAAVRQVVVFTHDERLPAALRYLELPARIVRVDRRAGSAVALEYVDDPVELYLRRAGALAADTKVPAVVAAKVIPGVCRSALEACVYEVVRRRRLGRGDSHESVEAALIAPTTLVSRLALAIHDDDQKGGEVYSWLNKHIGNWATDTVQVCNKGSHGPYSGGPGALVGGTRRLAEQLRAKLA